MATEFGANITQAAPVRSNVTPQAGVAERPALLEGLNGLFEQAGGLLEKRREEQSQSAISDFTKRQLMIADALDQGSIKSSAHARTMMRKNLMEAIDMAPGLTSDFIKAQSDILGLHGGADIVKEGSDEEQRLRARQDALYASGVWDGNPDTYKMVDNNIRAAEEATRQHKLRMETLDEELKMGQVSSQRRKQIEEEREQITNDYLRSVAPTEFNLVEAEFNKILNSDMSETEKLEAMDNYWNKWNSQVSSQLGNVDQTKASAYMKPFDMLYDTYQKRMTGEINDAEMERQYNRAVSIQKVLAVSDPAIARTAAVSEMLGQSGMQEVIFQGSGAQKAYVDFISKSFSETSRTPSTITSDGDERKGVKAGLTSVTSSLNRGTESERAEAATAMPRILQGIIQDAGHIEANPLAANEAINWMASSDFLTARTQNPELFENYVGQLGDILERNYDDEVWAMVRREFTEADVTIVPTGSRKDGSYEVSATSGVGVRSGTGGVEFFAIDPSQREMVQEARRLNKDLRPVINNTLKAGAHLEGRSDYEAVWGEVADQFLGGKGVTDIGGGDASDELSLNSFIETARPIVDLANSSNLIEIIDRTEGGGDYSTLFGHSQKGGKDFAGVDVSNMTIGEALSFANGEYGRWSRQQLGYKATPMGRYQIVGQTLQRVAGAMGLDMNTKFDAKTQDAMFAFLAQEALGRASTLSGKRRALRAVWEGFKHASDEELNRAIEEFESA